jgi:PPE-repeat protein
MFGAMEFTALPPEITSALIHAGPGAESLIQASGAWRQLGVDLEEAAEYYGSTLSSLMETWHGPSSMAMAQAAEPYLNWLRATAQQTQQIASSAQSAAAAFNSVQAAVVPVAQVSANRTRLAVLLATNGFGRNLPAIAQTEAEYQSMWANNSAAMNRYQAASAQATTLPEFSSPSFVTNPNSAATKASATSATTATTSATSAATSGQTTPAAFFPTDFDPNAGFVGLANVYANQFVSSGFPINLLSYLAQNQSAQALSGVNAQITQGVSAGEGALGGGAVGGLGAGGLGAAGGAGGAGGLGGLGFGGLSQVPTAAATGAGMRIGNLTVPPSAVNLLPSSQAPVQLASAASPLGASEAGMPMLPPLMPPPISAGSGWRKRKQPKYEDIAIGAELKGKVMDPPPSAG